MNRDNDDRFGEKILKFIPFLGKIESRDVGRALMIEAELQNSNPLKTRHYTYNNT